MNFPNARLTAIGLAFLLLAPAAFAKKKPKDLTPFKGNFTGTLVATQPGIAYSGTASVAITVPKKGTSAVINYSGLISTGTSTVPIAVVVNLSKDGSAAADDILMHLSTPRPATGTYTAGKKNLAFTTSFVDSGVTYALSGAMTVKDTKKRRNATLVFSIIANGSPLLTVTNTISAKAPKPPKDDK